MTYYIDRDGMGGVGAFPPSPLCMLMLSSRVIISVPLSVYLLISLTISFFFLGEAPLLTCLSFTQSIIHSSVF